MRYHDRYTLYQLNHSQQSLDALVRAEHLVSARLEPTLSPRYEAVLDLVFGAQGSYLALGFILVEGAMLVERESSPLSWPVWLRSRVREEELAALQREIEPWLQSLLLARFENDPQLRIFSGDVSVREDLATAQDLKLFGVTSYVPYLEALAPAVYASRFAYGKRVAVIGAQHAMGAAYLSGRAQEVAYAGGDDAFVRRWHSGLALAPYDAVQRYDVALGDAPAAIGIGGGNGTLQVPVARPLPMAALVTFDLEDSVAAGEFDVAVPQAPAPEASSLRFAANIGGSAGRIALIVRDDWDRIADADTDFTQTLKARLTGEGFTVAIVPGSAPLQPEDADLVHVIGKDHAAVIDATLRRMRAAGVPIAATPMLDDPAGEGLWGSGVTPLAYRGSTDLSMLELYLDGLARRRLVADGAPEPPTATGPVFDPAIRAMLGHANCVHVATPEEGVLLRQSYGYAGETVTGAPLAPGGIPADPSAVAGVDDFVLVHAPLDSRTSTVAMLRAARDSGLPTVFTGPVASAETHYFFNTYLGGRVWYVPVSALDAALLEGLYARARVYADVSWLGRGLTRFVRAAAHGASLVASSGSFARGLFPDAFTADPAKQDEIAAALTAAWTAGGQRREYRREEAARVADQAAALRAVVTAYDRASRALPVS